MYLKINSLEPSSVAAGAPDRQANEQQTLRGLQEVVADKGHHSNDVLTDFTALEIGARQRGPSTTVTVQKLPEGEIRRG